MPKGFILNLNTAENISNKQEMYIYFSLKMGGNCQFSL